MSVADCTVTIELEEAPVHLVKVTNPVPVSVEVEEELTKIISIPVGAQGPAGATGPQGPAGATGPAGPSGTSRVTKAGTVPGGSFAGSPKKFAVVFATPFADATYVIALSGINAREYSYEAKTSAGFTINANAATVLTAEVSWTAMVAGET